MEVQRTSFQDPLTVIEWRKLLENGELSTDTFFQKPEWAQIWWDGFGAIQPHAQLLLLRVTRGDECIAIAPFVRFTRSAVGLEPWSTIRFLGWPLSPYTDIICEQRNAVTAWNTLLQYIEEHFPHDWCEFDELSGTHELTTGRIDEWQKVLLPGECYLQLDAGEVMSKIHGTPSGLKKSLAKWNSDKRYRWRYLEGYNRALSNKLVSLNQLSFGAASWFNDERNLRFFHRISTAMGQQVWYAIIEQSDILSILMGFRKGNRLYHFTSGTNRNYQDQDLRLGLLNTYFLLSDMASNGLDTFDMLRGREAHKLHFGPEERVANNVHIIPSGARRRYAVAKKLQTLKQAAGM